MTGDFDTLDEDLKPILKVVGESIVLQKERFGGNFSVAMSIYNKSQRDFLRQIIGPDLVFVVMNLSKECQRKRLEARHGENISEDLLTVMTTISDHFEPTAEGEENTFDLSITEDMTIDEVFEKANEIVQNIQNNAMIKYDLFTNVKHFDNHNFFCIYA